MEVLIDDSQNHSSKASLNFLGLKKKHLQKECLEYDTKS